MKWLIILYCGNEIREIELAKSQRLTIGSDGKDDIYLDEHGISQSHITLVGLETGVQLSSVVPVRIGDNETKNHMLFAENIVRVTTEISLAIYAHANRNFVLALSGQNEVTIGRSGRCDISISGALVSSNHAVLRKGKNGWVLYDNKSRNGTFINKKRIKAAKLEENSLIFISGWKFRFTDNNLHLENEPGNINLSPKLNANTTARQLLDTVPFPYFQRSPRLKPEAKTHEFEILPPPNVGAKPNVSWLPVLLPPIFMVVVMLVIVSLMEAASAMMLAFTLPMSTIGIVMAVINYNSQMKKWRQQTRMAKEKYTQYLAEREAEIAAAETSYLQLMEALNPCVKECMSIAAKRDRRMWERSLEEDDFLNLRIGTGAVPSNVEIKIPQEQLSLEENPLLEDVKRLKEQHKVLTGIPITTGFLGIAAGLVGSRKDILNTARLILMGAAIHHSYEDVKIIAVFPESERRKWDWLRWLPHCWDEDRQQRFLACQREEAANVLRNFDSILKTRIRNIADNREAKPEAPHYVVMLADRALFESSGLTLGPITAAYGVTIIYAYGDMSLLPGECGTIIECGENAGSVYGKTKGGTAFVPDTISLEQIDDFARNLAPVRFRTSSKKAIMPDYVPLLEGFGVSKVDELDVLGRWSRSRPYRSIAAPIGIQESGDIFAFDIHEKGMGPHGIVAGATRWGKSETLTTWLLSVALNYHPHEVSFVLIDFKGDGLSGILMDLPHVAGRISNVNDIASIERNLRSLQGELLRRQHIFMDTGQENIHKYQEAFRSGRVAMPVNRSIITDSFEGSVHGVRRGENDPIREYGPMPYLIIVIDEFAELKTQFPDQMNNFIQIARVGGSLGIYMVLATQSPGGGIVSGQVSANSRFRISLKTAEAAESKDILGTSDAFNITARGRAFIKVGNNEVYEQVQTFFSKAPYRPGLGTKGPATKINIVELDGSRIRPEVYDKTIGIAGADFSEGRAVAQHIKDTAIRANIQAARQVWTEPLPESLILPWINHNHAIADEDYDIRLPWTGNAPRQGLIAEKRAYVSGEWKAINHGFAVTAGLIDDPEAQTQYPLILDFAADGHHALYGAPGSGKTEFIRTVLLSAAMTYTPEQVQFVALDFGTWGLKIFDGLPHTLLIADGSDKDKITQAEQFLLAELESRKRCFSMQGVSTLDAYQDITGKSIPAILITIDNMASLYNMYPDLLETISVLAREGGSLGLYLLMTTGSQVSFMYRLSQYIKCHLTLQLTDKGEYRQLVGGTGKIEPEPFPGRGLVKGPLEFQTALCTEGAREADRVKHLREMCDAMFNSWDGAKPALPRAFSDDVEVSELICSGDFAQIGYDKTHNPYELNINKMKGCVVAGPAGSGKTNLLGWIALALSKDSSSATYIYEKGDTLQSIHKNAITVNDGAGFDGIMSDIFNEYNLRKQTPFGEHPPQLTDANPTSAIIDSDLSTVGGESRQRVAVILDDFITFYNEISDETADILEIVMRDGAEYGILFYIAGDREGLIRFHNLSLPVLKLCLLHGNGVALSGNLREYTLFGSLHENEDGIIGPREGVIIHDGKAVAVKIANVKEACADA